MKTLAAFVGLLALFSLTQGMTRRLAIRGSSMADDAGCQGRLDLQQFSKVNKICDECYSLYKEIEVYELCRANCFGTKIFYGCMEALLVKDEMKSEVAAVLEDAHTGYYDLQSKKKSEMGISIFGCSDFKSIYNSYYQDALELPFFQFVAEKNPNV